MCKTSVNKTKTHLNYLQKYIEILQKSFPLPFYFYLHIKVLCSLVLQEGAAVLLLLHRVNRRSLAGRQAGEGWWDGDALAHLFPSSGGENGAPP